MSGNRFMADPAVMKAIADLQKAAEASAEKHGLAFKTFVVVGHTETATGVVLQGCACAGCGHDIGKAVAWAFDAEAEQAAATADQVH